VGGIWIAEQYSSAIPHSTLSAQCDNLLLLSSTKLTTKPTPIATHQLAQIPAEQNLQAAPRLIVVADGPQHPLQLVEKLC